MTKAEEFLITASPQQVDAWSAWALPWGRLSMEQSRFKGKLRQAIGDLDPCSGLRATYTTVARRGPDLENLLFYNVGSSPFAKTGRDLIRFERLVELPPEPTEKLSVRMAHHVRYKIEQQSAPFPSIAGAFLAESRADFALKTVEKLWKEFKENLHAVAASGLAVRRFAVQMTIPAPSHCRLDTSLSSTHSFLLFTRIAAASLSRLFAVLPPAFTKMRNWFATCCFATHSTLCSARGARLTSGALHFNGVRPTTAWLPPK
jgi:hypothetical protein